MKTIKKIVRFNNEVIFSLDTFIYFFLFLFFAFFPLVLKQLVGEDIFLIVAGISEIAWVLTVIAAVKYFIAGWKKVNFDGVRFLQDLKSNKEEKDNEN